MQIICIWEWDRQQRNRESLYAAKIQYYFCRLQFIQIDDEFRLIPVRMHITCLIRPWSQKIAVVPSLETVNAVIITNNTIPHKTLSESPQDFL